MSVSEEFPNSNLQQKHVKQLLKTEMCKFFLSNKCGKGVRCPFAHSISEIRDKPDLGKTSMCRDFLTTGNCTNPRCAFAHDERELRTTTGFFKTKMCSFAASGRCKHGAACRFAHNRSDLAPGPEQRAFGSDAGTPAGAQFRAPPAEAPPAPPSQSGQSSSNNGSSSEQHERDVFQGNGRDASSDQSTRDATSATVSTPEGSGDSMQDDSSVRGVRRRRPQVAPVRHCTTMMISNVPNFLTQGAIVSLLEDLTACMRGAFDFFYCPWNPNQDRNLGYAILNFFSRSTAAEFERQWANEPMLPGTHGAKKMKIVPAALQGRAANIRHFSGFSLAHHRDPRFRPLVRAAANEALRPMALPDEIVQPAQGNAARGPSAFAPAGQDYPEEDDDFPDPYQDSYQDAHTCQSARRQGHGHWGGSGAMQASALQERWGDSRRPAGAGPGQQGEPRFRPPGRGPARVGPAEGSPSFVAMNPMDYPEQVYQGLFQDMYHGQGASRPGRRDGGARGLPQAVLPRESWDEARMYAGPPDMRCLPQQEAGMMQQAPPRSPFMMPAGQHRVMMMMPPKQQGHLTDEQRSQAEDMMAGQCWLMMPSGVASSSS